MSDKLFVGTVPSGQRFFAVERDGRRMPLLNGKGEVEFWTKQECYDQRSGFTLVLAAMDKPEKLKVVGGGDGTR